MRARGLAAALAFVAALACVPAFAQTPEQRAELDRVERLGRDIYEHDRAAWLATDEMFVAIPEHERGELRGWVTFREGDAVIVDFVAERDGVLWSAHRSTFRDGALTEHGRVAIRLDEARVRLFRARHVAINAPTPICEAPYNVVVLPRDDASEVDVDVYLMPATTTEGLVRVGGFVRIGVNADEERVVDTQHFSRGCLAMQTEDNVATLVFSHITSPLPTETHVFLSWSHGIPLFVRTEDDIWQIENGRISLVPAGEPT